MDVHPPHEPVHTWRDALTHLAIVTVGLFIALMLEGLVEYGHHRELVHQARENIHRELERNHEQLTKDLTALDQELALSKAGLETLRYMRLHPDAHNQSITYKWSYSGLSDAAWTTARDTGALGYMPYAEVQEDAEVYRLQGNVMDQFATLSTRQADVLAPLYAQGEDFKKIPDTEWNGMLRTAATNLLDLGTLKQYMNMLNDSYMDTLKNH